MSLMNPKKVQGTGVGLELPMAVLVTLLVFFTSTQCMSILLIDSR